MVRLLIDENLPATLAPLLGCKCLHASELGERVLDRELWTFARDHGWTVLTKDADFFDYLVVHGPPPAVVWVRTGNLRRVDLERMMAEHMGQIAKMLETSHLIEVHKDRLEGFRF